MDRPLLPEEEDTVDFLGPIDDDNPLCPRNVDKVKSLLKQLNLQHDKNNESKSDREFFQRLFKPYYNKETSKWDDTEEKCRVQLVWAQNSEETKKKVAKLSVDDLEEDKNTNDVVNLSSNGKTSLNVMAHSVANTLSQCPGDNITVDFIIKSAQTEQLMEENGAEILRNLSAIKIEKKKYVVCNEVIKAMDSNSLMNIISFVSKVSSWDTYDSLHFFIENIVFQMVICRNLKNFNQAVLQKILGFLEKDEKFVVERLVTPIIDESSALDDQVLAFLTEVVTNLQDPSSQLIVLTAYLKSSVEKLCNQNQLTFLEVIIFNENLKIFEDYALLDTIISYLLESLLHDKKTAKNFNTNTKLGKFLLKFIKQLPSDIPSATFLKLSQIVEVQNSFLSKSISAEIKKKYRYV